MACNGEPGSAGHPGSPGYTGTADYIASPELMQTVNVAMTLSRPLLIKGEPGTGKTMLAESKITIADYYLKYRKNYQGAKVFYNEAITDYPASSAAVHARAQLAKIDAVLSGQEKNAAGTKPLPKKKRHFLFF